jgi:hypothetical protein
VVCTSTQFGVPSTYSVFVGMTNLSRIGNSPILVSRTYVVATTTLLFIVKTFDGADVVGDKPAR